MARPDENAEDAEHNAQEEPPASNTPVVAPSSDGKRPRGRPRKHPPILGTVEPPPSLDGAHPEGVTGVVAVPDGDSRVEAALLLHTASGPGTGPDGESASVPQKRPRGRPRKHPLPTAISHPAGAGAPPAALLGGTAILTHAPSVVSPAPLATTGQAAVILKRPRGRPRKHPLPDTGGISGGVSVPQDGTGRPGLVGEKRIAGLMPPADGPAAGRPRGRRRKAEPSILNPFCPDCGTYLRMFRPPRGRWRKVCPRCEPDRMVVKRDYRDYIDKTGMPCKDRGKCRPERCVKALECEEMARHR